MRQITGIFLIIAGVIYFAFQGFIFTTQQKVLDLGPIEATTTDATRVPYSPLVAGAVVLGGLVLLIPDRRLPI